MRAFEKDFLNGNITDRKKKINKGEKIQIKKFYDNFYNIN